VITLILIGAALGTALYALLITIAPPAPSALVALARFDARTAQPPIAALTAPTGGALTRSQHALGRWATAQLAHHGITYRRASADLALLGRDPDLALGTNILTAVLGLLLALLAVAAATAELGLDLPAGSPVIAATLGALTGFLLPDIDVRRAATARRTQFRHDLAIYLDLVALQMAAAAAPADALPGAARIGGSWPMLLLRDTLSAAVLAGRDQWLALATLAERIAVPELRELAMLVRLVAHDGARVRQTLIDRAATLRARELAEAQGHAGERHQTMQLGQILLGFAFVCFLLYPALPTVITGGS
jgi:tight adherence protein C